MKEKIILTIYIVHYRKIHQLKKTIALLKKNTSISFKLKILNNGYIDEEILSFLNKLEKEKDIEIVYSNKNLGPSKGRAELIKNIDTPYIMALDDDMYVNKNWDKPIFKFLKKNKQVGAMGFLLRNKNNRFWYLCGRNIFFQGNVIKEIYPKFNPNIFKTKFIEVDDICSGAIVYKKELKNILIWDPHYLIAFEDLDKGLPLKKSKYKFFISTQSKIIHDKVSQIGRYKDYNASRRDYHKIRKDYLYFVKKNKYRFDIFRHLFFKYFCLLPNAIIRKIVYLKLKYFP